MADNRTWRIIGERIRGVADTDLNKNILTDEEILTQRIFGLAKLDKQRRLHNAVTGAAVESLKRNG